MTMLQDPDQLFLACNTHLYFANYARRGAAGLRVLSSCGSRSKRERVGAGGGSGGGAGGGGGGDGK